MKNILIAFVAGSALINGFGCICYNMGKHSAYEDFISEKCWIGKDTRDIECTHYVKRSDSPKMKTYKLKRG